MSTYVSIYFPDDLVSLSPIYENYQFCNSKILQIDFSYFLTIFDLLQMPNPFLQKLSCYFLRT